MFLQDAQDKELLRDVADTSEQHYVRLGVVWIWASSRKHNDTSVLGSFQSEIYHLPQATVRERFSGLR